ncbi:MAG TPA: hypothetical protein VMY37_04275 [Thermoguttaceae bacterium]|nr:hypothetical protein [Thermoguttaceae bacterium]
MRYLLVFLLLTFAGTAQAAEDIQAALDQAWKDRGEVVLQPGTYLVKNSLLAHCTIRAVGSARLQWSGPETDDYILRLIGVDGEIHSPHLSGLNFDGAKKARGLYVDNVHRGVLENLTFYRTRGMGLKIDRGWVLHARNLGVMYCEGPALDASGLSAGSIYGLSIHDVTSADAPIVTITGAADVRQLGIEDCDSGKHPVVRLRKFWAGSLDGFISERLKGSAILQVEDSFGSRIDRLSHWQEPKGRMAVGVVLRNCEAVRIGTMQGWNIDTMVRIEGDSTNCQVKREWIKDQSGTTKHLIDHAGRGAKGEP